MREIACILVSRYNLPACLLFNPFINGLPSAIMVILSNSFWFLPPETIKILFYMNGRPPNIETSAKTTWYILFLSLFILLFLNSFRSAFLLCFMFFRITWGWAPVWVLASSCHFFSSATFSTAAYSFWWDSLENSRGGHQGCIYGNLCHFSSLATFSTAAFHSGEILYWYCQRWAPGCILA